MKKTILLLTALSLVAGASYAATPKKNAKAKNVKETVDFGKFKKGDMVLDLGVGIGASEVLQQTKNSNKEIVQDKKTKATFTQKLGFEVGVYNFTDHSSLGFGVNINNAAGAKHTTYTSGSYDYSYTVNEYTKTGNQFKRWQWTSASTMDRSGSGTAKADALIENFNVMLKMVYHHNFVKNLDTYAGIGFGVASVHNIYGNYRDTDGFAKTDKPFQEDYSNTWQFVYHYNDLDNVKWNGSSAAAKYCIGAFVGARYYFTKNWGITAEVGLNSWSIKKDFNDFDILNIGAVYKF